MISQVIFKIDSKLKEQAMKKAQIAGLPFASVLKFATKAFISGQLEVGLVGMEKLNATTAEEIKNAIKDIKKKKNLSPNFKNAKQAMQFLNR
ncbi:MAG: hypothetical protein WC323_03215 [Patescibacteria group bacterium]|jgi:antitoxin component of RelBE/YafQ-DinJ toxin-antitoxin module